MDKPAHAYHDLLRRILRGLLIYGLIPAAVLWAVGPIISNAARASDGAGYGALLAALGAVGLNWAAYAALHRAKPTLPVFAHGALCLMIVIAIEYEALPGTAALRSVLAYLFMIPAAAFLLLLSAWLAGRPSRPAHAASVGLRLILWAVLVGMAWQVVTDIEVKRVSRDTWITGGFMIAVILGLKAQKIYRACCRNASRRRASCLAAGKIVQIIGETHLDLDGDPVTRNYARIQYEVDGKTYEARADISRFTTRRFGREKFIGREVPVRYDPGDHASAYVNRIDKHIFDNPGNEENEPVTD